MQYLSVCAIFRRETKHLREWIEYHRLVGVEKFYLFTNDDDPRIGEVLAPYQRRGLVRLEYDSAYTQAAQMAVYTEAKNRLCGVCRWVAMIDLDEFLLPLSAATVSELLPPYEQYAALAVSWQLFGSSGLERNAGLVTENFNRRAPDDDDINRHVKVIIRPEHTGHFTTPHSIYSDDGIATVNENFEPVDGPFMNHTARMLRINHYCVRSREDFRVKASRSGQDESFFQRHDRNELYDDLLRVRFGDKLRGMLTAAHS